MKYVHRYARDWLFLTILFIITITCSTSAVLAVRSINASHEVLDKIEDCTTPNGKCAQQQRQSTGAVVNSIIDGTRIYNVVASVCAVEAAVQSPPLLPTQVESFINQCFIDKAKAQAAPGIEKQAGR